MKNIFEKSQVLLRFSIALGFLFPVLDRIGLLGPPGSVHVTWGNWSNFVNYTHRLMPYVSVQIAGFFGLVATLGEAVCAIMFIVGYKIKVAAYGSFILTLAFALSMLCFIQYRAPFDYSVFVVSFSSLLLASLPKEEAKESEATSRGISKRKFQGRQVQS